VTRADVLAEVRRAIGGESARVAVVADYLGVHPDTVRGLCQRGDLAYWQAVPGAQGSPLMVRASALAEWITNTERGPQGASSTH